MLVPSFAQLDCDERRKKALLLSMRILTLMVAPLAVGLGAVAGTLVKTFFDERWASIGLLLTILSVLSVVRPIGWISSSYLQVKNKPRTIMVLEAIKTLGVVILMYVFTSYVPKVAPWRGPEAWACVAVGVVFALNSFSYMWAIKKLDGIPLANQLCPLLPPRMMACAPMVVAVFAVRQGHEAHHLAPWIGLSLEVAVGVVSFIPSALLLAPAHRASS